ncbi:hypothetical protein SALBM217S_08394 [Streptomyces griseoloalbus]
MTESAWRISAARWAGVSVTDSEADAAEPAVRGAVPGAAVAAPDCTAVAISAATPARATAATRRCVVRGVRLWDVLLLNADSFCGAAGLRGLGRPAGGSAGRAERKCFEQ